MISAKQAEIAFSELGFSVNTEDAKIRLVWDYLRERAAKEDRINSQRKASRQFTKSG